MARSDQERFGESLRGSSLHVIDLEWDPETDEILLVGVGTDDREYAVPPGAIPKRERRLLERAGVVQFTNADAHRLLDAGWKIRGSVVDLQTAAHVLNENQDLDLDSVAKRYTRIRMDKRLRRVRGKVMFLRDDGTLVPIREAPHKQFQAYCKRDVAAERALFYDLMDRLRKRGLLDYFVNEEIPFTRVLIDMERTGIPLDLEETVALHNELATDRHTLAVRLLKKAKVPKGAPFKFSNPHHIRAYLHADVVRIVDRIQKGSKPPPGFVIDEEQAGERRQWDYGVWEIKGLSIPVGGDQQLESGEISIKEEVLMLNPHTRNHPWVKDYLEWKGLDKLVNVYLEPFVKKSYWDDDRKQWRISAHFKQTGTVTGRLSSYDFNLQNVPTRGELGKRMRGLFVAGKKYPFLMGDFSQLETRIMAHESQDPELLRIFREERDPFIEMASRVWGKQIGKDDPERYTMKTTWYAINYGAEAWKISKLLTKDGLPTTEDEAQDILDGLMDYLTVFFDWKDFLIADAHQKGYVTTLAGRRRRIEWNKLQGHKLTARGERMAANAKIQGSAADIVRRVMLAWARRKLDYLALCAQVHDELLYQYTRWVMKHIRDMDVRDLSDTAERGHGFDLSVPLKFEAKIAMSWGEK